MRSTIIAAVSFLATGALALPSLPSIPDLLCMDDSAANVVANNFKSLIAAYTNETANAVLASDYSDYTDSVTELIDGGCPSGPKTLGDVTFPTRAAFEAGQGGQPNITFDILNVWHNCDTVFLRWKSPQPNPGASASGQEQVTGIVVIETVQSLNLDQPYLIQTTFSEFNSAAWLVDLGIFVPANCSASSKRDLTEGEQVARRINSMPHIL